MQEAGTCFARKNNGLTLKLFSVKIIAIVFYFRFAYLELE